MPEAHLESNLEAFFRKRLRLAGGDVVKLIATERGVPDRLVMMPPGRLFLVELKTDKGALSPIQQVWHSKVLTRFGVRVYVLHGREEVLGWIRERVEEMVS